jgi:hypothetical protein
MQDTAEFNDPPFDRPIEENVTSTPAVSGDMERTQAWHDLVAHLAARVGKSLAAGLWVPVQYRKGLRPPIEKARMLARGLRCLRPDRNWFRG